MSKKGFTLVEILVVIVIIALISGIGVVSYRMFFKNGEEKYYDAIESDMLLAANDYFTDHRDLLPTGNGVYPVDLSDLIESKYLEPIKDTDGNLCTEGQVYVYRENNKYKYEVCLMNCGGHNSTGKYCDGTAESNVINIDAYVVGTNEKYDATKPYNSVKYLQKNQKIKVTFTMDNEKAAYYEAVNTTVSGVSYHCTKNSSGLCDITVDKSGTYKVTAYDSSDSTTRKVIASNQYFSVRITKAGPQFSITGLAKTVMTKTESACNGNVNAKPKKKVSYNIVKSNINEEYETVEYKIVKDGQDANSISFKSSGQSLIVNEQLESGKYQLIVKITNFAGEPTEVTKDFYISYLIDTKFSDGDYAGLSKTHEVVTGQNYNFVSTLPTEKSSYGKTLPIRWHLSTVTYSDSVRILGTTIVDRGCTYEIEGLMARPVTFSSNPETEYCKNPNYTGNKQVITKDAPENVTFSNNEQTDAGTHQVVAHVNSPNYAWADTLSYADKKFNCKINKVPATITCTDKDYTGSEQTGCSCSGGTIGGTYKATNAGEYTAKCTGDNNHSNVEKTWKINKVKATISCSNKTYNGSQQTGCSCSGGSIGGTYKATSIGSYTASCTGDSNHSNADNKSWNISKGTATCSLGSYSGTISGGESTTVSISSVGDGSLTCSSANTGVAACSISDSTLTISGKILSSNSSTTITVTRSDTSNYNGKSCSAYTVTVNKYQKYCGGGKYLKANNTTCSDCPAGKYCNGGTYTYSPSDQGITGTCAGGTYSTGGASSCTACASGTTSLAGASSCFTITNTFSADNPGYCSYITISQCRKGKTLAASSTSPYTYTAPETGRYMLEVYGGEGGGGLNNGTNEYTGNGGKGGYAKGTISLNKGDKLYVYPGCMGGNPSGGRNGGGNGMCWAGINPGQGGGGGGASHIAMTTDRGDLRNYVNNKSEILIVAGGGGGAGERGREGHEGGSGGGKKGNNGGGGSYPGGGGTQTEAGKKGDNDCINAGFGYGGTAPKENEVEGTWGGGGGGAGYYGGGAASFKTGGGPGESNGGGGGSGYVNTNKLTDTSLSTGKRSGNGVAVITWLGQ